MDMDASQLNREQLIKLKAATDALLQQKSKEFRDLSDLKERVGNELIALNSRSVLLGELIGDEPAQNPLLPPIERDGPLDGPRVDKGKPKKP